MVVLVAAGLLALLGESICPAQSPPTDEKQFIAAIKKVFTDFSYQMPGNFTEKDMAKLFQDWVDSKKLSIEEIDPGDMAEYYRGHIKISKIYFDEFVQNDQWQPRMREAGKYKLATAIAQTLVHEFRHASDDKAYKEKTGGFLSRTSDYWLNNIEPPAWNHGQEAMEKWLVKTWKEHEAHPTRDSAMKLTALTKNWIAYDDARKIKKITNTNLHFRPGGMNVLPEKWRQEIEELEAKTRKEWELAEILTSYPGPPPLTGKETIDELFGRLPPGLITDKDFENLFKKLTEASVAQRAGIDRASVTLKEKAIAKDVAEFADNRFKQHCQDALDRWRAKKKDFAQQAVEAWIRLETINLKLIYQPTPAVVDPKTQKAKVLVSVDRASQKKLDEALANVEDLVFKATAKVPKVTVADAWTPSPDGKEPQYTLPPPEPFKVKLERAFIIKSSIDLKTKRLSAGATIRFASEAPQSMAGRWEGPMIIETMPFLKIPKYQGCTQMIGPIKGKRCNLICIMTPQGADSGRATVTVSFPEERKMPPTSFNLTYKALPTSFSATDGDAISLSGTYSRANPGWTVSGSVQWNVPETKGTKEAAMSGTWSITNSAAK